MDRPKVVAIITGVISLLLAVGYLVLVQLLDFRGDMVPAPVSLLPAKAVASAMVAQFPKGLLGPALANFLW